MIENLTLDRTDFAILDLLQKNARIAVKEVAAEVGLAQSSVHERIRQLRDSGVLRGAHAVVDPHALGIGLEAILMLGLSKYERSTVEQFLDELATLPEVRFAYLVTGRYDVMCMSWCAICII
jgi:DNA-binding Lrp family transcriptional regulator